MDLFTNAGMQVVERGQAVHENRVRTAKLHKL